MKRKKSVFTCLMIFGLVLGMSSAASAAYNFSLVATSDSDGNTPKTSFDPNEVFYLFIRLDNVGGVAGAAFTLEYPSSVLTPPTTDAEGISTGITSPFPFTYNTNQTHRANSVVIGETGKIYLAGAAIDTSDGGALYSSGPNYLFRIRFEVKSDAVPGNFVVSLKQTRLCNPAAGYGTDANEDGICDAGDVPVTVLVGANPKTDPPTTSWTDLTLAFPDLLPTPPSPLAQATLNAKDGDSIDDAWEMTHFGNLTTATDVSDFDGDGYLDKYEALNGTGPKDPTTPPYVYPNYNASLDTRKHQVVFTEPANPFAEANASFDMDVNYFTSKGEQNLSGLTLRIHFNANILTWSGVSEVLVTGLVTDVNTLVPQEDTTNLDGDADTDYFVEVQWSGGSWPGVECTEASPAKLYTVTFTVADGVPEMTTSNVNFTAVPAAEHEFWSTPAEFEARAVEMGDVDGDGVINVFDVIKIARLALGLDVSGPVYHVAADLDGNGQINVFDVIRAARRSLGLD